MKQDLKPTFRELTPFRVKGVRAVRRTLGAIKTFVINHGDSPVGRAIFRTVPLVDNLLSPRYHPPDSKKLSDMIWKTNYFTRFGTSPIFDVETDKPVAIDSSDHKWPRGTLYDNSTNRNFNLKTYYFFKHRANLRVLDLGCSGGGMVRSFIEDGHTAIGVEGSDVSKKLRTGEWDTCPHHLFTADITSPFQVKTVSGEPMKFDLITSWEVLEHIAENKLDQLMENIARHLAPGGVFIGSVATFPDSDPATGAVYHVTLKPEDWWLGKFALHGFKPVHGHPYRPEDYVRGNGLSLKDWYPGDGLGFHVVLTR